LKLIITPVAYCPGADLCGTLFYLGSNRSILFWLFFLNPLLHLFVINLLRVLLSSKTLYSCCSSLFCIFLTKFIFHIFLLLVILELLDPLYYRSKIVFHWSFNIGVIESVFTLMIFLKTIWLSSSVEKTTPGQSKSLTFWSKTISCICLVYPGMLETPTDLVFFILK